jgi:glutathione S-transferase
MKLYYNPESCSMASHICMEETGASYEPCRVNLSENEHKSPDFLKINEHGLIPALMIDADTVITENLAIQYYITQTFPDAKLAPADARDRAQWLSFLAWISNTLHPAAKHVTRTYYYSLDEQTYPSIRQTGRETVWQCLMEIDKKLTGKNWIFGDQYTTADAYALPYFNGGKRFGLPVDELENYPAWKKRMLARRAVRTVLERERSNLLDGE